MRFLWRTDKALVRGKHLIKEEEIKGIQKILDELRMVKEEHDHRLIRSKISEVEKVTHHLAEVLMDATLKEALESKKLSEVT